MDSPRIAARVAGLRPTTVNRVLAEARQLQAEGRSLVSLMRGQPDSPTPAHIVETAIKALKAGRTGYADNQGEWNLRQAVAERLAADQGLAYDPRDEILITDGATCGISLALAVTVEPGDEVLVPDPVYDAYQSPIALWGGKARAIVSRVVAGRFTIDRAALEAVWTPRARVLLLNSPWNPVGAVLRTDELQTLLEFARDRDLLVISDEIYHGLVYDGRRHVSPATLSSDGRGRTLVVNSLSKSYAMTGWRVGYVAGPAALIEAMLLVLQQSSRGPATFVQDAAVCALRADQDCVRAMAAEYQARRDQVLAALGGLPDVEVLTPEGGLFVMVDVRRLGRPSDEIRRWLLREMGVVVIHGSAFGAAGEGTLRVSFAGGGQALREGLERLREGLGRLRAGAV